MKRTVLSRLVGTILAIAFLTAASLVMAQPPTPSVPNLINFQGRLTDNVGNPVTNGAHTVDFYIFPVRTGGVSVWSESQTPSTTGGLFTTQLGLVNALPQTLFKDYDSLFLEIVADAQTISPRTLLTSTPSTRVADNLEVSSSILPGQVAFETDPSQHRLSMLGNDGLENFRLWGNNWGEILLYDSDFTNDLAVRLDAENIYSGPNGGQLYLQGGPAPIYMTAGIAGDPSVQFPSDAVNSGEILDEPGVSNSDNFGFLTLGTGAGTTYVLDSVDIDIPASGYVEVTCDGYMNLAHTTGASSSFYTTLSKFRGDGSIYTGSAVARVPADIATSSYWAFPMSSSRLFVEAGPAIYRYYVMITHESGTNLSSDGLDYYSLRAKYFPSLYGTSTIANAPSGINRPMTTTASGTSAPVSNVEVTTITAADHKARLEAERTKQVAELEARVKQLEEQVKSGQYPNLAPGTPRKER